MRKEIKHNFEQFGLFLKEVKQRNEGYFRKY